MTGIGIGSRMGKTNGTKSTGTFRFRGASGSLGYIAGVEYHLTVFMSFKSEREQIVIEKFNRDTGEPAGGRCIYSSSTSFAKNWAATKVFDGPDPIDYFDEISKSIPIQLEQILDILEEEVYGTN